MTNVAAQFDFGARERERERGKKFYESSKMEAKAKRACKKVTKGGGVSKVTYLIGGMEVRKSKKRVLIYYLFSLISMLIFLNDNQRVKCKSISNNNNNNNNQAADTRQQQQLSPPAAKWSPIRNFKSEIISKATNAIEANSSFNGAHAQRSQPHLGQQEEKGMIASPVASVMQLVNAPNLEPNHQRHLVEEARTFRVNKEKDEQNDPLLAAPSSYRESADSYDNNNNNNNNNNYERRGNHDHLSRGNNDEDDENNQFNEPRLSHSKSKHSNSDSSESADGDDSSSNEPTRNRRKQQQQSLRAQATQNQERTSKTRGGARSEEEERDAEAEREEADTKAAAAEQEAAEASEAEAANKAALDEQQQAQKEIIKQQAESEAKAIRAQQEALMNQQRLHQKIIMSRQNELANHTNLRSSSSNNNNNNLGYGADLGPHKFRQTLNDEDRGEKSSWPKYSSQNQPDESAFDGEGRSAGGNRRLDRLQSRMHYLKERDRYMKERRNYFKKRRHHDDESGPLNQESAEAAALAYVPQLDDSPPPHHHQHQNQPLDTQFSDGLLSALGASAADNDELSGDYSDRHTSLINAPQATGSSSQDGAESAPAPVASEAADGGREEKTAETRSVPEYSSIKVIQANELRETLGARAVANNTTTEPAADNQKAESSNHLLSPSSEAVANAAPNDLQAAAQHQYGAHFSSLKKHLKHYYQFIESHKKGQFNSGFKRGNKKFQVSGHTSQHKGHAEGHVKWNSKKGKAVQYWNLNHTDKKHHHHH